ncbi:hypothetical protein AO385_1943 [Moraxella catarrhalis]|uniref:Uncharacterized protein n=1 Tax=Moraxella catarrhalis TaxID=480 RepID=A0A198UDP3_MORCA|nr:hypothetical protein AO384_1882 [Moraxella catarrhalis]OAU95519.1 hypothetical protein AO385_1943 [Moraxella catarrhalis]OAV02110.1 hypothetical protein AO382_0476 [Moraxella catarrhalis]
MVTNHPETIDNPKTDQTVTSPNSQAKIHTQIWVLMSS